MGAPGAPGLSVIVPAWNEAERIGACLQELYGQLLPLHPELIVVDDGSSDGTHEAALQWIARHPDANARVLRIPHRGKGAAVWAGVRRSCGRDVVYIDADMEIPAAEIGRLLACRARIGADVVVGSKRALRWRQLPGPLPRRLVSITFSWLVSRLFALPVRDTQTGIKLFPGSWLRAAVTGARVPGWLFDVELLALAVRAGLRVREEPIHIERRRPASRIGPRELWRCLGELVLLIRLLEAAPRRPAQDAPRRPAALGHGRG